MVTSNLRALAGQFVARVGARVAAAAFQAILLVALARDLGPGHFGDVASSMTVTAIVATVAGLGVNSLALRWVAYRRSEAMTGDLIAVAVLAMLVSCSVGSMFGGAISGGPQLIIIAACVLTAGDVGGEVASSILSGRLRMAQAAYLLVGRRAVVVLVYMVGRTATDDGLALLAAGAAGILVLAPIARGTTRPTLRGLRFIVREGRPYWMASIGAQVTALDVLVVRSTLGPAWGGHYAAAVRLVSPATMVPSTLVSIVVPNLIGGYRVSRRRLLGLGATLAVGMAATAPALAGAVPIVLGPDYADSRALAAALMVALGISCLSQTMQAILIAENRGAWVASAVGAGGTCGILMLAILCVTIGSSSLPWAAIAVQVWIAVGMGIGVLRLPSDNASLSSELV